MGYIFQVQKIKIFDLVIFKINPHKFISKLKQQLLVSKFIECLQFFRLNDPQEVLDILGINLCNCTQYCRLTQKIVYTKSYDIIYNADLTKYSAEHYSWQNKTFLIFALLMYKLHIPFGILHPKQALISHLGDCSQPVKFLCNYGEEIRITNRSQLCSHLTLGSKLVVQDALTTVPSRDHTAQPNIPVAVAVPIPFAMFTMCLYITMLYSGITVGFRS